MAGSSRHRGVFLAAALMVVAAFSLVPGVASASGGGGCGGPVTDEAGTRVKIESYCFTPTIVRVEPGDAVTFANMDAAPHTVLGANGAWGSYDVLKRGREATYTFAEAGVFPYVCTYHPGMVGTVVVGIALDQEGEVGPQARRALRLVEALKLETNLPIETWDESGTTAAARAMGGTSENLDARAAAVILQEFLDARNR